LKIVLRFTYNGTNTDFYIEECSAMSVQNVQDVDLVRKKYGTLDFFRRCDVGYPYKIFSVVFKKNYKTTLPKLEILHGYKDDYDDPSIIKMYYQYKIDEDAGTSPKNNVPVQMIRQDFKKDYFMGYDTPEKITIRFVETTYSGVGVLETPQLIANRIPIS